MRSGRRATLRCRALVRAWLLVFLACAAPLACRMPVAADETPNALYDAAYDRWHALPVAPFTTYDGRFTLTRGDRTQLRLYSVAFRSSDRKCRVTGVPIDKHDRPDPPQVTKRCLTPEFAFTFVPQTAVATDATGLDLAVPTPDPNESPEPKTIASVRVRSRPYAIALAGHETIGGIETVHLALRPYRNANKHVLRDVWIDPATNGVVRLRGETTSGPNLIHVVFTATYAEDASTQTLEHVEAYGKAQILFLHASGNVSFDLTNVEHPASIPDAEFR